MLNPIGFLIGYFLMKSTQQKTVRAQAEQQVLGYMEKPWFRDLMNKRLKK